MDYALRPARPQTDLCRPCPRGFQQLVAQPVARVASEVDCVVLRGDSHSCAIYSFRRGALRSAG